MIVRQRTLYAKARPSVLIASRHFSTRPSIAHDKPVQSYISQTRDPYLNLSIEHYLLQKSAPDSTVLFQYVNRPSIIIGRNQNPWLEVNLALLNASTNQPASAVETDRSPHGVNDLSKIDLVRRRSGGGTVFHDSGNVNWTVICPSSNFTRDKHAELVVRALRDIGAHRTRVNERHDIVLDQGGSRSSRVCGPETSWGADQDTHSTPWQAEGEARGRRALKVSGSAYKLTRGRALHHGTCLLSSPNLGLISQFLHSEAKPFIKARGVGSVSSPVGNLGLSNEDFIAAVQNEFGRMYSPGGLPTAETVGEDWLEIEEVRKGYDELRSPDWTYLQTPQFTISNRPVEPPSTRFPLTDTTDLPYVSLTVRNGAITETQISLSDLPDDFEHSLADVLSQLNVHEIKDWRTLFNKAGLGTGQSYAFADWLQDMLPAPIERHSVEAA